ncbi:hydrogenase iron-sulfur subunit [Candidatus Bathyarchaeota archaeon]|nr:hydrogenase iron-sulfur subunit [Candidatus Bathyarchaeota archaeon]
MTNFEPKIVGYLCNWCSYAGADLSGVSRIQYPPNIRIIRVMCSGRVEPSMPLNLLINGADGVMVTGCHIGDCHYITGNLHAKRKFTLLRKLVEKTGMSPERVMLEWVSASEGQKFANLVKDFTEKIKNLGPNPVEDNPELLLNLKAAKLVSDETRLRSFVGKEEKLVTEGNVYGEVYTEEEFDNIMEDALEDEYIRNKIRIILNQKPQSVKEIAEKIRVDTKDILEHIVVMRQRGWIDLDEITGQTPVYRIMEVA